MTPGEGRRGFGASILSGNSGVQTRVHQHVWSYQGEQWSRTILGGEFRVGTSENIADEIFVLAMGT